MTHWKLSSLNPLPEDRYNFIQRLEFAGRRYSKRPLIQPLYSLIRRAASVSQAPGEVALLSHPRNPLEKDCNAVQGKHPLTIMSANMWHDWPRQRDLMARAEKLTKMVEDQDVDILLLQEVSRTRKVKMDEWLCDRLGMACMYTRANGHSEIGFEEGLAVFSRYALAEPKLMQLDNNLNPFIRRIALGAVVDTPCEKLMVFSTHLGLLKRRNAAQFSHLHTWIKSLPQKYTVLIGGDFNSHETSPQIRKTQASWLDTYRLIHPTAKGFTHELRWPWGNRIRQRRLDYIFLQPGDTRWHILDTRLLQTPGLAHSDHHAVLTRITPSMNDTNTQFGD